MSQRSKKKLDMRLKVNKSAEKVKEVSKEKSKTIEPKSIIIPVLKKNLEPPKPIGPSMRQKLIQDLNKDRQMNQSKLSDSFVMI